MGGITPTLPPIDHSGGHVTSTTLDEGFEEPKINFDLIRHLSTMFPNTLPNYVPDPGSMGVLVGQQNVIDHLRAIYDKQTKKGT